VPASGNGTSDNRHPRAAREASREPDRLVSRVGIESAHDGLVDADELAPLRDHLGVARASEDSAIQTMPASSMSTRRSPMGRDMHRFGH